MPKRMTEQIKDAAVENMVKNMVVLRTMLDLSQEELATLIGVGRQTLVAIENKKRKMTWNTFLSLLFVFSQNKETSFLLEVFGIYTPLMKEIYSGF